MGRTRQDQVRHSKEGWERGKKAKKKGNPRYRKARVWSPKLRKYVYRYVLRKK